jgi:hypothetical protein
MWGRLKDRELSLEEGAVLGGLNETVGVLHVAHEPGRGQEGVDLRRVVAGVVADAEALCALVLRARGVCGGAGLCRGFGCVCEESITRASTMGVAPGPPRMGSRIESSRRKTEGVSALGAWAEGAVPVHGILNRPALHVGVAVL